MKLISKALRAYKIVIGVAVVLITTHLYADDVVPVKNMNTLLKAIKSGVIEHQGILKKRENDFKNSLNKQKLLLSNSEKEYQNEEQESERLEALYESNEIKLQDQKDILEKRLGSLKELFGHVTGAAGDLRTNLNTSLTSAQFPNRDEFLEDFIKKMNSSIQLPEIKEFEQLWYEMQKEIIESGNVVRFESSVIKPNGIQGVQNVVRIGSYNLVSEGKYLHYDSGTGLVSELSKQPKNRYLDYVDDFETAIKSYGINNETSSILFPVGLDPTGPKGGGLLKALIDTPTLTERWHQGGVVGYIITLVGIVALIIALWRLYTLIKLDIGVNAQLTRQQVTNDNPLGRVLQVYNNNTRIDPESLEMKLAEAIVKERPEIEKGLSALKIISMVAPLMGLLGTVTGMIITFQAITIFGSGDPKAMAGGISAALVTTVLGLVVAIPTVLLHSLLQARSKRILNIIEQQSAGLIAEQAELGVPANARAI